MFSQSLNNSLYAYFIMRRAGENIFNFSNMILKKFLIFQNLVLNPIHWENIYPFLSVCPFFLKLNIHEQMIVDFCTSIYVLNYV